MSSNNPPVKKLYRSREDSMLAGVCGGIAKHLEIDSTIVRVLWAVFTLFYLIGLIVYIIMYFIMPLEPESSDVY